IVIKPLRERLSSLPPAAKKVSGILEKVPPSVRESAPGGEEKKKERSPGYTALLAAGYVAASLAVFFVLYILSRFIFSSMKG
ncbi:MAG: hypothetical protein J6331_09885, partial [Lentisphaeria bacterium]|nr:hypothetical protein [Lentisphaeria bacterium]